MKKVFIIAEAGVNHNGDLNLAFQLVDKAVEIGADCVKFQTFKTENIVTKTSPKANYQMLVTDKTESQFDMLKKLELQKDDFKKIKDYCKTKGIQFLSTPYNPEDATLLNDLGVEAFKIASGQLVELPFLKFVAKFGKQMIISTGMANLAEVYKAVEAIKSTGNTDVIVLQCNTDYPSKIEDTNMKAMITMRDALGVTVGYSDHVPTNYACYAAVALGAEVIEKHFTLDKNMEGPDHKCSLEPEEFRELIAGVRAVEKCLGTGVKIPSQSEVNNTYGMRRSLVARNDIKAGTVLTEAHFGFKRPANGLSPNYLETLIGKKAAKDMLQDEAFTFESILFLMEVAVSSIAFLGKPVEEFVNTCIQNNFVPEFSSGMSFRDDMETVFLSAKTKKKYAHNYFPAPEVPFVLNLASANKEIRKKSIAHCVKGIQLSEKAGAPFFSAHAGFCIDPDPNELGQQLSRAKSIDRNLHWTIFIDSIHEVLKESKATGLNFLLENNVLAKMNVYEDGTNPLLCVESDECKKMIADANDKRVGLLLDTAHVKVSANTLGFDKIKFFNDLVENTQCIHHSDNEGEFDNNLSITSDYWFLPLLKNYPKILHVLEVKKISSAEVAAQLLHF